MDVEKELDFIVVGGGASGFFGAINLARIGQKVLILEKFQKVLTKLAVSGGGRCNVTHNQFDPKLLIQNYPRGSKALLGLFHHFNPKDMMAWLEQAGVSLKIEADGRIFPVSNSSSTIIECFVNEATKEGVEIIKGCEVLDIVCQPNHCEVTTDQGVFKSKNVLIASGSNKAVWEIIKKLGHHIIEPTPSLFALNTPNSIFNHLSGLSVSPATISYNNHSFTGPLLLTHFGLSGPAALKLSSFAALDFAGMGYKAELYIDFLPNTSSNELLNLFTKETKTFNQIQLGLPKRLWELLLQTLNLDKNKPLNHISKNDKNRLIQALKKSAVMMDGKTTHKEEFVTAGGVDLKEVNFSTMQSKLHPHLYFAGEVLNIDGVTGGFNFQAAWTTSYLISSKLNSR